MEFKYFNKLILFILYNRILSQLFLGFLIAQNISVFWINRCQFYSLILMYSLTNNSKLLLLNLIVYLIKISFNKKLKFLFLILVK
uniref:7TM_GPCR_Srx domain-containing protein n=1 Tax=Strongyloides papillosus TaxID=174720 RepID=A0A0N5BFA9_STREA